MKIYTKSGDRGQTSLATGKRVRKSDKRLEAYGTADELNSFVGLLRAGCVLYENVDNQLDWVQNRLFDLGAILAGSDMLLSHATVHQLEAWIDAMQAELPPLRAFILPGGSEAIARCHVCRTVTRRLERNVVSCCGENDGEKLSEDVLCFINRLSDYFFVLARYIAQKEQISPLIWKK